MSGSTALQSHLETGVTTVARAWAVTRRDGVQLGFTDHDRDLNFDGLVFRADTGLTASALQTSTGLSVDNTEALGALTDAAISEADIAAGRYDEAEVLVWLVNWADVAERRVLFRGSIGEIRRGNGAFHAELRGLTETLNRPVGRVFQKPCSAVLGDGSCGVDLTVAAHRFEGPVASVEDGRAFVLEGAGAFATGWFQRGRLDVISGAGAGLFGAIKQDLTTASGARRIELWEPLRATFNAGDMLRLTVGCDKRFKTCREKFANALNFQGFPDIPEDDWVMVHPTRAKSLSGGSRR